ncbi:hypothetical protein CC79DRAFT_1326825 [Sarocladium strictum]
MRFVSFVLLIAPLAAAATLPMTSASLPTILQSDDVRKFREFLRQPLSPEQRSAYRGITMTGMTGIMYDQIIHTDITTPEELIAAEMFSFFCHPADDPKGRYLFSTGRGLIAKFNPLYVQKSIEMNGDPPIRKETISELDAIYRESSTADRYTPEELAILIEETLNEVANDYLEWEKTYFGKPNLQARQQGWYCKKQGTYCHDINHCPKLRTIQRTRCVCGHYRTCQTETLDLPPYPGHCLFGSHCVD